MTGWVFFVTAGMTGAVLGSFVNVVIYRGPVMWRLVDAPPRGNLAFPRSNCPNCKAPIRAVHLIPLLSYAMLRGKCAACQAPIPLRYPVVELLGAMAALSSAMVFGATMAGVLSLLFLLTLLALAFIDAETGYLPDMLTLPLIFLGLGANAFAVFTPIVAAAVGAAIGYAAFRLIDIAFLHLRGVEGLGQGDAKLLAAIGAWLGWTALPVVVFLAALLALLGVLAQSISGVRIARDTAIAFGPALAAAGAVALIARGLALPFFA
ncbi:MAG: prepilin peptidase [Pseudomonadota bacterium]